ncbi:hypothetical protein GOODEAATRI_026832, partial [Goodea atripinnis]
TPFSGLLFRHEGWPLCIHDKIVVQLCPLDQHLLHPGDFYLLVSPAAATLACGAHSASCRSSVSVKPCLLLCSVSAGSRHVEQQEVPLEALTSLFSMAWLDSVNRERERRGATRLERCVLSAHGDVFRVPWEDVVYPQFINRPQTTTNQERESSLKDKNDPRLSRKDVKLLPFPAKPNQSTVSSDDEDSEGEYVELTELPVLTRFSPQKGSLTQSISLQHRTRTSIHTKLHTDTLTPHTEIQSTSHTNTHLHQLSTETSQNTSTPSTTVTPSSIAHFNSNTHSCFCTEVSSHTLQCCKLLEENFSQDSSGVLHISSGPPITCSAPPEVKEQTEGTTSGGSPNMHAQSERCTQHGEGKENEQKVGEEEQGKEEEKEANNRRSEGLESVCGEREERLQQGNGDDQMYKEKEEEQLCDKNVGRRSTDHQPEGSTCEFLPDHSHISAGSSPEEPENPFVAPAQSSQSSQSRFHVVLLRSGAVCLPGTRDRAGRALLTISTSNPVWLSPDCDRAELLRLLLYYISTLRTEAQAMGLTVLVDARQAAPGSAIFPAFQTLQ